MLNNYMKRDHYVYVLKDEDGIIRYVGKTNNYKSRISGHFKKSSNIIIRNLINERWTHDHVYSSPNEEDALKTEADLIKKYKHQLYNIKDRGGITRTTTKITLTLKNIKTGELKHFVNQYDAANFLNLHPSTVSYLVNGKRKHIARTWTLEHIPPESITFNYRDKGCYVDDPARYFKLYDMHEGKYITFKSNSDCVRRLGTDSTTVSQLMSGRLNSIKKGRYRLSPDSKSQYKKFIVYDMVENKTLEYKTRAEFCKQFNFNSSIVSELAKGKIKLLAKRFILDPRSE